MSIFSDLNKPQESRRTELVVDGKTLVFDTLPFGDDYFDILYPEDPAAVQRECVHYANLQGRQRPFKTDVWADVEAIRRTFVVTNEDQRPEASEIWPLYDSRPKIFGMMRGAAMVALGLAENPQPNSGKDSWAGVFKQAKDAERLIREGEDPKVLVANIRRLAAMALKDFAALEDESDALSDHPDDHDSLMDGLSGN